MEKRNIIVIGASAGGFEALKTIVQNLPSDLDASIFIVWHMSADVRGILPEVLNRFNTVEAANAHDNEPIKANRIYVAPPDHHLLIEEGRLRVTRGPKENRFRPAVDPLFRSAAYTYGNRVIGVVLSGALDDGSAGLWRVKQSGGITVVQDPSDAQVPSMPENAMRVVDVDHCVPADELAALITKLSSEEVTSNPDVMKDKRTKTEIDIAAEKNALNRGSLELGVLSPFACPECHGVLSRIQDGPLTRFRCHTGHAYSIDTLMASLTESIIFKPSQEPASESETVMIASDEPVARQLEEELIGLKTQLRNSIEHHEYQAEELKASNEELQAMNEELRSAAEELETSKEELQSINEELRTVNQELKVKIEETTVTSNNLQNLINSANVGTIFLDRSFAIRLFTPAVLEVFNLKSGDYGRPVTDITHKLQYTGLLHDAETVLEKLTVIEREVSTTDNRSFMIRLLPYRTSEDRINGVVITFFDITSRKESEEALRQSEQQMRLLIESAKDYAIYTMDNERRVISWNSGAQLIFGYSESEMIGNSGDIVFVPEDREESIPEQEIQNAAGEGRAENERWHLRKDGSRFWGSGTTQPVHDTHGQIIGFVKIMRDLTEQRQLQDALRKSEEEYRLQLEREVKLRTAELSASKELFSTLVENSPDVITRWDKDLRLVFANKAFERKLGVQIEKLLDKTNSEMGLPEEFVGPYLKSLRKAFDTGKTVEHFHSSPMPEGEVYFFSRLTPERNSEGEIETVMAIARDITAMKKTEIALKKNRDLLQSILDNSFIGMSVLIPVRDETGAITDFEIRLTNQELDNETGRTDLVGKLYAREFPGIRKAGLFDVMVRVIETGKSEGLEYLYPYEGFRKWYSCMFVKMDDGLLATNLNITERKHAEEHVLRSEERLRLFVTESSDLIYQMSPDWKVMHILQSDNFLPRTESPTSKWMELYIPKEEWPRMQAAIDIATARKELFEMEHRVLQEDGRIGWASSRAVPFLNEHGEIVEWFGIASNISARKLFEEERNKNYLLLQQSELVAATGTWDYDLTTRTFTWSDGMYRLFNRKKGTEISPEIYMEYATPAYRDLAVRIADQIKQGNAEFEETLTMQVGESQKIMKIKATMIRNEQGFPIRVLGVDVDITASRQAEERLRQMEAEQQLEIFRVTLRTQEEERRRISESLHNGLGQLMYGIQISINQLRKEKALTDPQKYDEAKSFTEKLVAEAIKESRTISHELMPATLEQFGLRSAIDDVCQQLSGKIAFDLRYKDTTPRLEKFLELAVFRTVQELMLNVVKHAGGTQASVQVNIKPSLIHIVVSDNGRGLADAYESKSGIGLSSIRSKIKLLNGVVKINSVPDKGTEVTVQIPVNNQKS